MMLFLNISINIGFASLPLSGCITYNQLLKTIFIKCASANFSDIYNQLNDNNILSRPSATDKIWLLNAGLTIQKGSTFYINSTDTNWLKISTTTDGMNLNEIHVLGSLKVDSVKITSWDTTTNNYGATNGTRQTVQDKLVLNQGSVRPVIKVEGGATGTTDITNSEIAYLGYEGGTRAGASGLSYYGGDNSILKNNNIHDLYFGFYSKGIGGMVIENNHIYDNDIYGLDPHTGTHDMSIRNNSIYNNGGFGIICSLDCSKITIEKNIIHNNYHGIMLSRNMTNSIVQDNTIYNENNTGISVSQSSNNQILKNAISDSTTGILLNAGASNNIISKNIITNSGEGIVQSNDVGTGNSIKNNKIIRH
ncbi:MAG: right-handed parallel beta-helix repeat-containing protein [Candidatus Nitrosocosmicus sp.]